MPMAARHPAFRLLALCAGFSFSLFCCNQATGDARNRNPPIFQKPCVDDLVLADLTSHYPIPVDLSPDGTLILTRTVNWSDNAFGISLVERVSGRALYTLSWPSPILRLEWRHDSSEISFFSVRGSESGRDLYIWNFRQNLVRYIDTPLTTSEAQVRWAPNGKLLAFSDPQQGLVAVGASGDEPAFTLARDVVLFDWLPDSSTIALVDKNRLDRLALIGVATGQSNSQVGIPRARILDLAASPTGSSVLLVELTDSGLWKIEKVDTRTFKRSTLVRSRSRLGSPTWLPNGQIFCFQRFDKTRAKVIVNDQTSGRSMALEDLAGMNDIRGVSPDSRTVVVAHRGYGPVALFGLSLTGERPQILYASNSPGLPSVKAVSASALAEDGTRVPLLVWRAPWREREPTAVIRVHGGVGVASDQLPVWEEHIQLFVKHGIHFIGVNYRGGKANARQRREDVLAAIQYAHRILGVPYKRIVLLGHSSGADLAADTCRVRPDWCGILVLVSFGKVEDELQSLKLIKTYPRVILFYPAYDSTPRFVVLRNLRAAFGEDIVEAPGTSLYQFPDDHNLMYPRSWAAVYSAILAHFHSSTCAADPDESN
jgi:dipeptidyl aminopeptidase/acylaminoacyl peptidase